MLNNNGPLLKRTLRVNKASQLRTLHRRSVNLSSHIDFYFPDRNCSYAGFYTREWWKEKDDAHDCTVAQLEKAIEGYFTADALPLSLSNKPGISGKVSTPQPLQ